MSSLPATLATAAAALLGLLLFTTAATSAISTALAHTAPAATAPASTDPTGPGQPDDRIPPRPEAGRGGAADTVADIPARLLPLYQHAASTCPGLSWTVLAAIGKIETDHGRASLPGVRFGANSAGAQGSMQFLPATFAAYAKNLPPGGATPPSPFNASDAIHTAANYLCATGARNNHDLSAALWAYNHSSTYRDTVPAQARRYAITPAASGRSTTRSSADPGANPGRGGPAAAASARDNPVPDGTSSAAARAVAFARAQIGLPYVWGGDGGAEGGFDCSGLTHAAWATAGIDLPRTAQTQYNAGPLLPPGIPPQPGDLVFFGTPTHIRHVGIALGEATTLMVHAPDRGQKVRIQDYRQMPEFAGLSRPRN
jgi:cell wall-associated NlpC family hydrolase